MPYIEIDFALYLIYIFSVLLSYCIAVFYFYFSVLVDYYIMTSSTDVLLGLENIKFLY